MGFSDKGALWAASALTQQYLDIDIRKIMVDGCRPPNGHASGEHPDWIQATEIGKSLGLSGHAANCLLMRDGYVSRDRDQRGKAYYIPTDKAKGLCVRARVRELGARSFPVLRWHPSIVEKLRPAVPLQALLPEIENRQDCHE